MKHVLAVIDNGLSESKVLWTADGQPVRLMRVSPEIIEVNARNILETGLSSGKPEDNALIELSDDRLFAVGKQARELRGKSPVEETKYQMSVYKIVSIVGAIAAHLKTEDLTVTISTLLPYAEYQDRKPFIELLKSHLKEFKFRGETVNCKIQQIFVKPEGAGIAIHHSNDTPEFDEQNTLVLMLGHRDASLLPFERGAPNTGLGEQLGDQLGFLEFQKQVVSRAALNLPAKHQARLPEYLFKAKTDPAYVEIIAKQVVSGREIGKKTETIERAINDSLIWYVDTLTHWIKSVLGPFLYELDEVLISGGTALYLADDLTDFFQSLPKLRQKEPITWGLDSQAELEALIGQLLPPELAVRLADVYGLYLDTIDRVELKPVARVEPVAPLEDTAVEAEVEIAAEAEPEKSNGKSKAATTTAKNGRNSKPSLPRLPKSTTR